MAFNLPCPICSPLNKTACLKLTTFKFKPMQPIVYIKSYGRGTALYVVKKSNVNGMGLRETGASGIADSKYKQLMENFCCKGKKRNKVVLEKKIESRVCALLLLLLLMLVLLQMGEILIC